MKQLNAKEWKEQLDSSDGGIMLDVRTEAEYAEKNIEGALQQNIFEQEEFMKFIDTLDKSKPYFVYCRSGARSGNACSYMDSIGFKETYNLAGGIMSWPY